MAFEVAVAMVVVGIAIGIQVGLWLGARGKGKALKLVALQAQLATDEAAAANRLLNQYAPSVDIR